jgi:hypothetical protein
MSTWAMGGINYLVKIRDSLITYDDSWNDDEQKMLNSISIMEVD